MTSRNQKRAVILSIYFILFFGLLWWIIGVLRPDETCFDGKKNQNEIDIDCGGVCPACPQQINASQLQVKSAYVIDGGHNTLDAVAQVTNPNTHFGSSNVTYRFVVKDKSGTVIVEKEDTTFILPLETKNIVAINIKSFDTEINVKELSVECVVVGTVWHEFTEFQAPKVIITNQQYGITTSSVNYSSASGLVHNDSPYDFNRIIVTVVLKDAQNIPIAAQRTELHTMDAGMVRAFSVPWPQRFEGEVVSYDMNVAVDVFDSLNFRKKYIPGGQYQNLQ